MSEHRPPTEALPPALLVDRLPQEERSQERFRRFLGDMALSRTVERETIADTTPTLLSAVYDAHFMPDTEAGEQGRQMIDVNASTAVNEILYKAGHVLAVKAQRDSDGGFSQHGHKMLDINANALRYWTDQPRLKARAKVEALNEHRLEEADRAKLLEDYWFVVPSLAPDDVPKKVVRDAGFFQETETGVWQATTMNNGVRVTESAFVAGVPEPRPLSTAEVPQTTEVSRHDLEAVRAVYAKLGMNVENMSATEWLNTPLLVSKKVMPNGVIDLVKLYDAAIGPDIFFGQKTPPQDYQTYKELCQRRSDDLQATVGAVTDELIAQAPWLTTPMAACEALAEIAKKHSVKQAVDDPTLDASVFGAEAAYHIEHARFAMSMDQNANVEAIVERAQDTAIASMCGMLVGGGTDKDDQDPQKANQLLGAGNDQESGANQKTMRCIKCKENVKAKEVIKAKSWRCPSCKHEVDVCTGRVLQEGRTHVENVRSQSAAQAILDLFQNITDNTHSNVTNNVNDKELQPA